VLLRPALIALQFLTCIPIRLKSPPAGRELGLSLLWYPVVGLLLGVLLWIASVLVRPINVSLAAALVVTLWVACTGALHLDGLADTADAWVGGRGHRGRTLAIMKDPYSGPVAVAAVVCLVLLKFGALSSLHEVRAALSWTELRLEYGYILPPVLARATVPLLFAQTPYVRSGGLGADLAQYQSRSGGRWVAALTGLAAIVLFGRHGLLATVAAVLVYFLMRRAFIRRLGGMTGDGAGALIEVVEAVSLIALVLYR
jgi:adenosylcobinamide-GDP ribazoletransferase